MSPANNAPQATGNRRSRQRPLLAVIAALFLVACGITVFMTTTDIRANAARDDEILASEVRAAADEIGLYLVSSQEMVETFARENEALLSAIAQTPDDTVLRQQLSSSLREQFPGHFTYTIADRSGTDLIDDLDGFVGEACVLSIRDYVGHLTDSHSADADYRTVIHPQAGNYHYDVMAPWSDGDELKGVFFVSFFPTQIRSILQSHQGSGHHLAIINTDRPTLLEVNTYGARDKISARRNINLTADEVARISAAREIPNSRWRLVGYARQGLHRQYQIDAWFRSAMILSLIALVAGVSAAVITRRRPA